MHKNGGRKRGTKSTPAYLQRCRWCGVEFVCSRWDARACCHEHSIQVSRCKSAGKTPPHVAKHRDDARRDFLAQQARSPRLPYCGEED